MVLCIVFNVLAQEITGSIEGRILNPKGQPLSEVNIEISGESLQGTRGSTSDARGYFFILTLPPGRYDINISHIAHHNLEIVDVLVEVANTTAIGTIKMTSRTLQAPEVIVFGDRPVIDPVSTKYGVNIPSSYFEKLPVSRSYRDMVTIVPQVNVNYFGGQPVFAGEAANKYFVDGVEVTDPLFGGRSTDLPYNFIKEVEVKTGGYAVDTRSSMGGLINVITNSGSNQFHGSAFGFYTSNQFVDNSKYSSLGQGDYNEFDVGFGLGGPLVLDKLWFYAAYNPTFYRKDVQIPGHDIYVDQRLTHKFALKLDWRALDNFKVNLTVNGDPIQRDQVLTYSDVDSFANPDPLLRNQTAGSVNYSLNNTFSVNNNIILQGVIARVDHYALTVPATERGKNEIQFWDNPTGTLSGGDGQKNWDTFRSSTFVKISTTLLLDQHNFNAGIDYKYNSFYNDSEFYYLDRYNDSSYIEFISNWRGQVQSHVPAVFVQDSWRINELTVTAGLRWEDHTVIDGNGDKIQNISVPLLPHIGLVLIPEPDNRRRFFVSFRRFSHEYAQLVTNFNLGYDRRISYDHDPRLDPTGGDIYREEIHPIKPAQKKLDGQYIDEYSIGYESELGWNMKGSVQAVYRTVGEAIDDIWYDKTQSHEVGNPGKGLLSAVPQARRDYKALVFSVERQRDKHFNFMASYVLSENYGNYEFAGNQSFLFDNPATAWENVNGLLQNDRSHVFKFSGIYNFSFGLTSGITFFAQSGTPLSEFAVAGRWSSNPRIKFLKKRGTSGRTPAIWDLNARFTYNINLIANLYSKLILDIFHIGTPQKAVDFDQVRFNNFEETDPNKNYGEATAWQPSMSVRLGMEVGF